jgi:elongation factor P hydroxylase
MNSTAQSPSGLHNPASPFYFNTSAHLLRITAQKANTPAELLAALRICPEDSVFQHTFRTLQEHHFIREGYTNDFAHWTLTDCREPALGRQLSNVDVRDFISLRDLRERFIGILERYLSAHPEASTQPARKRFYFCASDIVVIPTTFAARTMEEFLNGIRSVSVHSIHHHFIEARLRLKLLSNDFSQWLQNDAGMAEAARDLNRIDIYTSTLEGVRHQIIRVLKRSLRNQKIA